MSLEAESLADAVARYVNEGFLPPCKLSVRCGCGIGHTVPQKISGERDVKLSLRVKEPMENARLIVRQNGREIESMRIKRALPAEMIQLSVKSGSMDKHGDLEVYAEW